MKILEKKEAMQFLEDHGLQHYWDRDDHGVVVDLYRDGKLAVGAATGKSYLEALTAAINEFKYLFLRGK